MEVGFYYHLACDCGWQWALEESNSSCCLCWVDIPSLFFLPTSPKIDINLRLPLQQFK